ncbi:replication-relaxation family protein [Hamadaea sp. NPDC051192]|uniref:replication-relaxation family protein n=1 Tax=Hamadaea sp. NPDC051192 TaxID=3154940 RepID=UPI00341DDE22
MRNSDRVLRVQHQLTERDWRLLGWLYDHAVLTSFQIAHALFPSLNRAQRRLSQLTGLGLVERFRPFRLEGGSHPYHYALAHTGALIVAATRGDEPPRRATSTTRLHRIATSRNLDHRLGINQFFTDLAGHERLHPGARLHHFWPDTRLNRFFNPPGTNAFGLVNADALGVWAERGQTVAFYLEHDTGTEALTVLVDKLTGYGNLVRRGGPAWPVLFWLHSTTREANLHRRLADRKLNVPAATAARDRLDGKNPAEAVWHLHGAAAPLLRLAELPMPGTVDPAEFDSASPGRTR